MKSVQQPTVSTRKAQIFQKSRSHFKILSARRGTSWIHKYLGLPYKILSPRQPGVWDLCTQGQIPVKRKLPWERHQKHERLPLVLVGVVKLTLRPLYSSSHRQGGWAGHRAGLLVFEKRSLVKPGIVISRSHSTQSHFSNTNFKISRASNIGDLTYTRLIMNYVRRALG